MKSEKDGMHYNALDPSDSNKIADSTSMWCCLIYIIMPSLFVEPLHYLGPERNDRVS